MHGGAFVRVNTRRVRGVAAVGNRDVRCGVASARESMVRRVYVPDQQWFEQYKKTPPRGSQKVGRRGGGFVCVSVTPVHAGCRIVRDTQDIGWEG